jgi:hypothetical protein
MDQVSMLGWNSREGRDKYREDIMSVKYITHVEIVHSEK